MKIWPILKKILLHEEPIAGLEISDTFVRLILLNLDKKSGKIITLAHAEQPLEPGIIINGELKDQNKLYAALTKLKSGLSLPISYVVASVPSDLVYTKILSFPKSIEGQKLDEAVKMAVDFQLPYKTDDVYYSWEIFSNPKTQKAFIAEAPKKAINPYIECVRRAFHLVAVEFHSASFARIAFFEKNKAVLLKINNQSSQSFFIIKDSVVYFSRTIEADTAEKKSKNEAEKIISFYESGNDEKISKIIELGKDEAMIDEKINFPEAAKAPWLVSLGAAKRGIVPRHQDNFICLSPISAQKAYKYQKAVSFTSILAKLIIGLAIFFSISFIGSWILIIALQQNTAGQSDNLRNLPEMPDLTAVEEKINTANSLIAATAEIIKTSPQWSILITELQGLIISGISINGLNLPAAGETLYINGMADNRAVLNQFRDKLKTSPVLDEIRLPLTNLDQKEDIPFTISFKLKNPELIYLK